MARMRLPFAKPKSVSDYVDPPKGTHAISTSQLPNQPDWARAMLCAELSFFAYRVANRYRNTSSELEQDRARIQTAARILGYEADVISTPTQQAVIFYNNLEAVVAFEGSRADNLGHYNRNLITHLRGLKTFAPRHFAGKFHYGFSTALDEPVISDEYGDSAYIGPPSLYDSILTKLKQLQHEHEGMRLFLTGHSAGGAIATVLDARLLHDLPAMQVEGIYTYGQPRFCDREFKNAYNKIHGTRLFRFEIFGDPMPALPPYHEQKSVHLGNWIPMDEQGRILGMDDSSIIQETLKRSSPEIFELLKAYSETYEDTHPSKHGAYKVEHSENDIEKHSGLSRLFGPANYNKHRLRTYANAILKYIEHHPETIEHGKYDAMQLAINYWRLGLIEERTQELMYLLPSNEMREDLAQIRSELKIQIDSIERLQNNPERTLSSDKVTSGTPALLENNGHSGEIPETHILTMALSRSMLIEQDHHIIEGSLHRLDNLLAESLKQEMPEDGISVVQTTRALINDTIAAMAHMYQTATPIYGRA